LEDVHELRGGSRLHVTGGAVSITQTWTPWDHAGRDRWVEQQEDAVDCVRQAISTAIRAATVGAKRALLMLSGGIDSSILAASLGTHGCPYTCLNLTSAGAAGDERAYARAVASHLGVRLIEAHWDVTTVDIFRSEARNLPNPIARSFMQGTCRRLAQAVEASEADLTLDGGGGDNMFFALRSVAPVTDALLWGRSIAQCWSTARSIAEMAQVSMATVLRRAGARAFRFSPAYRWQVEHNFLAPDILQSEDLQPRHPWIEPPRGAETGTAAHIALLTAAQGWAEGNDLHSPVRHRSPLASQPVAEACLKVPSWWWFKEGINRIVARDAFRERLPPAILERKAKGSPDSYIGEIFTANRHHIRSLLLEGAMARAHLLDLPRLEHALASQELVQGTDYHRIMALADVEAWIAAQGSPPEKARVAAK
jgi:asparagine synthase (glutamine-hydrolysing)